MFLYTRVVGLPELAMDGYGRGSRSGIRSTTSAPRGHTGAR